MNGPYQEIRGPGRQIPEDRKQHIIVLLVRMIHQRLSASGIENTESPARKELEHRRHLREERMR
jgi:hypothetical protein